jgi:hypothetical protein
MLHYYSAAAERTFPHNAGKYSIYQTMRGLSQKAAFHLVTTLLEYLLLRWLQKWIPVLQKFQAWLRDKILRKEVHLVKA